jgi:hypothetical protein
LLTHFVLFGQLGFGFSRFSPVASGPISEANQLFVTVCYDRDWLLPLSGSRPDNPKQNDSIKLFPFKIFGKNLKESATMIQEVTRSERMQKLNEVTDMEEGRGRE